MASPIKNERPVGIEKVNSSIVIGKAQNNGTAAASAEV